MIPDSILRRKPLRILFIGGLTLVLPRLILVFIQSTAPVRRGVECSYHSLHFFFLLLLTKQLALSLISPPTVSPSSVLLCSAVGPPLPPAEKRKQPALRDHSNSFCPEPLAVPRMSRNG